MKKKIWGLILSLAVLAAMMVAMGSTAAAASFTELNTEIFTPTYTYDSGLTVTRSISEGKGVFLETESVSLNSGGYYKFTNSTNYDVLLKTSSQFLYLDKCDSSGTVTESLDSVKLTNTGITVAKGATLYFKVGSSSGYLYGNYNISNERETAYSGYPYVTMNEDAVGGPKTYYCSMGSAGNVWYKVTFNDTKSFRISVNTGRAYIYQNNSTTASDSVEANQVSDPIKCEKGDTVYILLSGSFGKIIRATDCTKEFVELKTISYEENYYTAAVGETVSIPLNWSKEGTDDNDPYDSSVTYYLDGQEKTSLAGEDNNATTFTYTPSSTAIGKHTLKAVTSEGLTAETTVVVTSAAIPASAVKSTGTWKSSKISWSTVYSGAGTSGYYIYLRNSAGTYVKKGSTTGSSYTLSGLSANKNYYVRIVGYVTVDGTKYASAVSTAKTVKVITASSTKPKITSLKSKGKKYYAKKYTSGYWTSAGNWVKGYWTPAHTVFKYAVKYKKVSGATTYGANTSGFSASKKTGSVSVNGKKSSKKVKVKIRSIRKSGTSVAYGPWSTTKSVTVK